MRHLAAVEAAVAACPPFAKAEDLGLAARIRAPAARRKVRVVPRTAVQADQVDQVDQVDQETFGVLGGPVGLATTADPADLATTADPAVQVTSAALVVPATTADPADRVVQETSAGLVDQVTSADPVVHMTSDHDPLMRSAASTVSRGATEQRRGAGDRHHVPDGADHSLLLAEYGTKGRSTTGASKNNRFGIGTITVGASGSSASGFRCNEPYG